MNGLITFHDGINFGAFLQVYALQNFLNNKGIQNEIINYKNKLHLFNEYKCLIYTRRANLLYLNFKKVIKFKEAQKKLKCTNFFTKIEHFKKKYDNIFFGSDEIWNYMNSFVGNDFVYFGKGLSADKFISYAASFGAVNYGDTIPDVLRELLRSFHAISVRDVNSFRILKDFYCGAIEIVLDPIFLYDFKMDIENTVHEKNYIMVYTVGLDPDVQNKLKEYAANKGKNLISVGYLNSFCNSNVIGIGPFEFLNYIINADEIVTSMFHGVLFAIKYRKQFCIVVDPYRVNKLSTVVKTFKIENRIFINDFLAVFNTQVNHDFIHNVIEKEKIKSEGFIINSIKK
jgi:hypothetical protein